MQSLLELLMLPLQPVVLSIFLLLQYWSTTVVTFAAIDYISNTALLLWLCCCYFCIHQICFYQSCVCDLSSCNSYQRTYRTMDSSVITWVICEFSTIESTLDVHERLIQPLCFPALVTPFSHNYILTPPLHLHSFFFISPPLSALPHSSQRGSEWLCSIEKRRNMGTEVATVWSN